jgi:hypothetical protein
VIDCKQIGAGRLLVKAIESGAQSEYRLYVSGDSHQPALEFLRAWVHSVVSEGHAKSNQGSQLVGALTEKLRVRFEVEPCTLIQLLAEVAAAGDTFHDAYGAIEAVLRPSLRTYAVALKECPSPRISAVAAVLSLEKHDPADDAALRRAAAELTEAYVVRLLRALAERPRGESTTEVTKAVAERHDLSKETRDLAERLNAP